MIMAKIPGSEEDDNNKRAIQLASTAVIINQKITTFSTIEFIPNQGNSNLNVAKPHRNSFSALKLNNVKNHQISNRDNRYITSIPRWKRVHINILRYY